MNCRQAVFVYRWFFYNESMLMVFIFLCIEGTLSCRSQEEIGNMTNKHSYFSNSSTWGGWSPPEGNDTWMAWILIWGSENSSNFDSTEEGPGPGSGWPRYWKGMVAAKGLGKGNSGVPPPPWAYVPLGYGKPQFCFLQPAAGNCRDYSYRWGFNPTHNRCQSFVYSGCGGNQNNFKDRQSCNAACVDVPSTGCETQEKINFEEMIYD